MSRASRYRYVWPILGGMAVAGLAAAILRYVG